MKIVTFIKDGQGLSGWLTTGGVVDMHLADVRLPSDVLSFIKEHDKYFDIIKNGNLETLPPHYSMDEVRLTTPLPNPPSVRDFLSFEEHMLNASKTFGHSISDTYYDIPVFYFTNHNAIYGPDDEIRRPAAETKMDLEVEIAVVIGKKGHDIKPEDVEDYIFGYTVFNDWTARSIQKEEMTMPLGPAKGKDFANAFGPCIVTKDEFEQYRCTISREDHPEHLRMPLTTDGRFDVKMIGRINGQTICEGNYKTAYWNFTQMIERASRNHVNLLPGDILGSGTVGWGSLIENKFSVHRPIEPGDVVEVEIEGIGILRNVVS